MCEKVWRLLFFARGQFCSAGGSSAAARQRAPLARKQRTPLPQDLEVLFDWLGWRKTLNEEHQDTNIPCVVGAGQKMDQTQDAVLTNRGARRQSKTEIWAMTCAANTKNQQTR
jgi:hypothetical protein